MARTEMTTKLGFISVTADANKESQLMETQDTGATVMPHQGHFLSHNKDCLLPNIFEVSIGGSPSSLSTIKSKADGR